MNYASTINIEEVMKFYNSGDKTFETDFSTLWNTMECCRGFEDLKDEISSSRKASYILGLMFYFCVENLSDLCKLIVCVSQTLRVLNRHRGFQNIGLPNPVLTVENSAGNNPIQPTQSKSVHTTCMVSNSSLQNFRRLLDPLKCTM